MRITFQSFVTFALILGLWPNISHALTCPDLDWLAVNFIMEIGRASAFAVCCLAAIIFLSTLVIDRINNTSTRVGQTLVISILIALLSGINIFSSLALAGEVYMMLGLTNLLGLADNTALNLIGLGVVFFAFVFASGLVLFSLRSSPLARRLIPLITIAICILLFYFLAFPVFAYSPFQCPDPSIASIATFAVVPITGYIFLGLLTYYLRKYLDFVKR